METKFNVGDRPYRVTVSMPDYDMAFFENDRGKMGARMIGFFSPVQIDPIDEISVSKGVVTYICSHKDRPHDHFEDYPDFYREDELYATEEEAVAICREKNSKRWELLEEGKRYLEGRGLL